MLIRFLSNLRERINTGQGFFLILLASLVGALTGLAAVFFIRLIAYIQITVYSGAERFFPILGAWSFVLVPVLGALIVGPIIAFWASEAKGHGVPEVMEALALKGGRIRPRVAIAKIIASALCIGTGGSAGREGPIIQVGSALGSTIGQRLHLSAELTKNLVACGAAAGIAATFNAPIAGVAFATEVLLSDFEVSMFGNVVISAVSASIVSQVFLGARPAFEVPSYIMRSPWEILLYIVLGLLAALVGVMFIRMLSSLENIFDDWQCNPALKPAVGAFLLGITGYAYLYFSGFLSFSAQGFRLGMPLVENIPHVFGSGFTFIESVLQGKVGFWLLAALVILKPLATSFTLGSGNSGGVFAPSLFTGAMLGGAFGYVAQALFPDIAGEIGAYALVGMAAVFAAAARAPFTSMLIVFEMSNDYHLILPLMAAGMVASSFANWLYPESIYTVKLTKKGIRLEHGRDLDVMQGVAVREVMNDAPITVSVDDSLSHLFALFQDTHLKGFPVVKDEKNLYGTINLQDLEDFLVARPEAKIGDFIVGDVVAPNPVTIFADDPVWSAIRKMSPKDLARLPVVSKFDGKELVGTISRSDILRAYDVGLMRKQQGQAVRERMILRKVSDMEFVEIGIRETSPCVGKRVADIKLPHGVNLVSLERLDGSMYIPHGGTKIVVGDNLTILSRVRLLKDVRRMFEG